MRAIGPLDLSEFLEDQILIFTPDTDSRICHRHAYKVPGVNALNADAAAVGSKFDCVAEQVVENLLKTHAICLNQKFTLNLLFNLDVLGNDQRMNDGEYFRHGILHRKLFAVQLQLSRLNLGKVQDVVDQLQQMG